MDKNWKKFEKPKTRREWVKTALVGLFLLALIHVFVGFPLGGWWPAYGRSAWPTIKWWTVPPYLSGYYHADYDKDPEPGDIVWFKVPGCLVSSDIKRVEKVETRDGQPYMWLTTDNIGMTGEASSDDDDARFGWVSGSRIIATVDDIWTPERYRRSRTSEGRFVNRIQFKYSPQVTRWSPGEEYAAIDLEDQLLLVGADGSFKGLPKNPADVRWQGNELHLVYQVEEGGEIYKQEMLARAPDFDLTKKPPTRYSVSFPGYEIREVIEFYEVAAGERKVLEVLDEGTYIYLSSPGPILISSRGGARSLEPGSVLPLKKGRHTLEIPNGPPFDVPLGQGRVYAVLLTKQPALA